MPCQDDWLNDLSSMPPVSVTMQARNLLAVFPVPDDEPLDGAVLDPHPAASSAMAQTAATSVNLPLTFTSCAGAACGHPGNSGGLFAAVTVGWGQVVPDVPPGIARTVVLAPPPGKRESTVLTWMLPNRDLRRFRPWSGGGCPSERHR